MNLKHTELICLLLFTTLSLASQTVTLNIPNSVCAQNDPTVGNKIVYTVSDLLSECINIYGSNPGGVALDLNTGATSMNSNMVATVLAMTKLYYVSGDGGQKLYSFGQACGESDVDDANINVVYGESPVSTPLSFDDVTTVQLPIAKSQILTVSGNSTANGNTGSKIFLSVNASKGNTATISINSNERQGQVYIALFSATGNGSAVAMLHTKSSNLSFTVDQNVFVVPLISPVVSSEAGQTIILFEVGDPKRNGKVVAEEEG